MAKLSDLLGGGAGGAVPIWASGMTVEQGGVVLSPAAGLKPYIRTAATGGGTTDPALDTAKYRAYGGRVAKSLMGNDSTSPVDIPTFGAAAWRLSSDLRQTLSGSMTAATYKTLVSVTGQGVLKFCASGQTDSTSRTQSLRITIDGVVVFEKTVASVATPNKGILGLGGAVDSTTMVRFDRCRFNESLVVEVKSSITETDKMYVLTNYEVQ